MLDLKKNHFLISSPRSGTTWMSKMLNAHPSVCCVERRLFGDYADFVVDDNQEQPRLRVTLDKYINSLLLHHGLPSKNKVALTRGVIKAIVKEEQNNTKKKIIVDKITPYLNTSHHVLSQIDVYFPKSKLIFLVRDGRDVLTSGVFHWFNKQPIDLKLNAFEKKRRQLFLESNSSKLDRFFQDKEIEQWANEWMQPLQLIEEAQKNHEVKVIFYEKMLENPNIVLKDTLAFLSAKAKTTLVDNCVNVASFKQMSHGREKGVADYSAHVRKGISGDWKNYFTYSDAKLFNDIAGHMLIKFGYERNSEWIEKLR